MAISENVPNHGIPFVRSFGTISEFWDSKAHAWYTHEPLGNKEGIITLIQNQLWPFLNYLDKRNSVLDIAAGANNQEAVVLEALRVLKPGMWAVFVDFRTNGAHLSIRQFRTEQLKAFLEAKGFKGIQQEILQTKTDYKAQLELLAVRKPSSLTPKS